MKYKNNIIFFGVIICFVLSGFAALLYQTAWMRQFSVIFGTSELAVATILSAYMAGLALGAAIAGKYINKITRPILFYGILEAAIAISALCVPLLMGLASLLYINFLGNQLSPGDASGLGQSMFYLIVAFLVLIIPTGCMGATLPLLIKYVVKSEDQIGSRVGMLYAMNTAGAIGGTTAAGFLLLPLLGLSGTIWVGVGINILVFFIAAAIASLIKTQTNDNISSPKKTDIKIKLDSTTSYRWILPLMLLSGMATFTYEVLWTRLLGHILGGSVAAFSTMLASFLSGIAIGSAIASRFSKTRDGSVKIFIYIQCLIAATSILIYQYFNYIDSSFGLTNNIFIALTILLPATLFIGATFPLAVRMLADNKNVAAQASARVYAWNTFGAIAGAAIAGFFLIPLLKYEGAIKLAVSANLFIALFASLFILKKKKTYTLSVSIIFLIALIAYRPSMPENILRTSPIVDKSEGEIIYYDVGRSATVIVFEEDGFFNLRTNGLPEAGTDLKGAPPSKNSQQLLATMPVLARPDTSEMLIIGFGAGVAVEGVPSTVNNIDVIELEPKVIEANKIIGNRRAVDPLKDNRVNIITNDARSALALTTKKYDAIVSQPSHPWTAGASHLYTREFMSLAKEHLTTDGIFLQWMNSQFLNEDLLKSLCATMLDVYRYVRVYQWSPEVLFFLGSQRPINPEYNMSISGRPLIDDPLHYLERGIGSVEDLVVALNMDQENIKEFSKGAKLLTDNMNLMATESSRAQERGTALNYRDLEDLFLPYDPLLQSNSFIHNNFPIELEFSYIAERLEILGNKKRAVNLGNALEEKNLSQSLLVIALGLSRQGQRKESQELLRRSLEADPTNDQARFNLIKPWLAEINEPDTPDYIKDAASQITGSGAAVINGWQAIIEGNYNFLVDSDELIAATKPTDQWYLESIKLRADWRIKVNNPEYQPALSREARRIIDSAITIIDDVDLYGLRIAASYVAEDTPEILETSRRLIYIIRNEINLVKNDLYDIPIEDIDRKIIQIEALKIVLNEMIESQNTDINNIDSIQNSLDEVLEELADLKLIV
tara:strand:+ start:9920 stop:13099 length:3180 start_codon:yes stop_codon:yes gene_type:complete